MKRLPTALILASLLLGSPAYAQSRTTASSVDQVVTEATAKGFSGVVLVGDATNIMYEKAVGFADRDARLPHSTTVPWRWASISKQITAVVVAQLVAEGKIALDGSVADYLSASQFPAPNAKAITVRQLLQHTSGLPNPTDGSTAEAPMTAFYRRTVDPKTVHSGPTREFCSGTPKQAPGERFDYNNCDYIVLGALIEQVTGRPYAEVVAARVLRPLKLTSVYLAGGAGTEQRRSPVRGYDDATRPEPALNVATYGASASWMGTPRDLMTLSQAMLGDTLLSAKMKEQFWAGNPKLGYSALGVWSFSAPLKGCAGEVELIERRGHVGGVQVRNILAPKLSKVVVVFTNRNDWTFGEIWQGSGFSYELLTAAFCS